MLCHMSRRTKTRDCGKQINESNCSLFLFLNLKQSNILANASMSVKGKG